MTPTKPESKAGRVAAIALALMAAGCAGDIRDDEGQRPVVRMDDLLQPTPAHFKRLRDERWRKEFAESAARYERERESERVTTDVHGCGGSYSWDADERKCIASIDFRNDTVTPVYGRVTVNGKLQCFFPVEPQP